jgi:very-short-patch-repair endonuclease
MKAHNKTSLKDIRRELRQKMTPAEIVLWEKLRHGKFLSLKFKRQHSIGNYIVDFYCAHPRIVIEVDGKVHLEKEQKEKDKFRDENLRDMNYIVLRFSNNKILNSTKEVLKKIEAAIRTT